MRDDLLRGSRLELECLRRPQLWLQASRGPCRCPLQEGAGETECRGRTLSDRSRIHGEWLLWPKYEFSRTGQAPAMGSLAGLRECGDEWLEGRNAREVKVPRQNPRLQDSELLELGEVSHRL